METNHKGRTSENRPDQNILEDIWNAFQVEDTLRSIDLQDISLAVENGHVFLSGHVAKDLHSQRMQGIAHSISGVVAVHNHLVTDQGLALQVSQSLAKDERLRSLVLPVYSSHGWISLGGQVPNRELQKAAGIAAARVPTVRGVIALPRVMDEAEEEPRLAIQPAIKARVYPQNGIEGSVSQVIIRPENRLVTYAIVRLNPPEDKKPAAGEFLVPVEAMDEVSAEEIVLKRGVPDLKGFSVFSPGEYPIAPLTWEPPYPYKVGKVRWPREEMPCGEKESRAQRADQFPGENMDILKRNLPDTPVSSASGSDPGTERNFA